MKLLLDTHALLFAWGAPEQLSERARDVIADPRNELYMSQVSSLEICLKARIGKLALPEPAERYIPSRVQRFGMRYLPLEDADIFDMLALPQPHKDPFDWLLLATARRMAMPIVSRDAAFAGYPVERVW